MTSEELSINFIWHIWFISLDDDNSLGWLYDFLDHSVPDFISDRNFCRRDRCRFDTMIIVYSILKEWSSELKLAVCSINFQVVLGD